MDAREAALFTLNTCERQGGWSDGALKKQISAAGLDSRDAALATQLCAGVLQNQMLLDFYLQISLISPQAHGEAGGPGPAPGGSTRCSFLAGSPTVQRWTARWPLPGPTVRIPGLRGW